MGKLEAEQRQALIETLKIRFERNMARHEGVGWARVQAKLESEPEKLWSLGEMERTGGEPDVIGYGTGRQKSTFLLIARRRVPRAAGAFATIGKRSRRGSNTSQRTTLFRWPPIWEPNC